MRDFERERKEMVTHQIVARGIRDPRVLEAMLRTPRELFVPEALAEFAYRDTPLPIGEGQTISQPYIVALMLQAMNVEPTDRVLEIGAGSGYLAALLGALAREVYALERHEALVELAAKRIEALSLNNVHVMLANGTLGLPQHAPYDAIIVSAGGPGVPQSLLDQLAVGGRLVIPIGEDPSRQRLVRFTRINERQLEREDLCDVRFVPLIGEQGWPETPAFTPFAEQSEPAGRTSHDALLIMRSAAQPFPDIESAELGPLLDRIGGARLVLLGEATHGTSEFYRLRARITRELILRHGFNAVAVEADWPDAERIDRYIRHRPRSRHEWRAFTRFPTWMWRNEEILELIEWMRAYNAEVRDPVRQAGFYGLDLYSLYSSASAVIHYLEEVDPAAAKIARERYGCLSPWESDPAAYGRAALNEKFRSCEGAVIEMLRDLMQRRLEYIERDGERFIDALQNAHLVANAEQYYRAMYYGARESWNLRDQHMFDTLQLLLAARAAGGAQAKAVVWAHNSHVGNAAATEMGVRGELNIGALARAEYGEGAFLVGFGTDHGTVTAASSWDGPRERMQVRPAHPESYEYLAHQTGIPAFFLHLREPKHQDLRWVLSRARLERAIGVIYRPDTEMQSHYFQAMLPEQFDEYIWFDETHALNPLQEVQVTGVPETYPFGL